MKLGSTEPDTRHEPLSMPGFHSGFGDAYYTIVWRENAATHFTRGSI